MRFAEASVFFFCFHVVIAIVRWSEHYEVKMIYKRNLVRRSCEAVIIEPRTVIFYTNIAAV